MLSAMNTADLRRKFETQFGTSASIFRAPGRVNLIGEHTDYNDGFVMPAAVGFSAYIAIAPRADRKLIIRSEEFPGEFEFDLDNLPASRAGVWCDYVVGVASSLRLNHKLTGANLLVHGEVPIGAGLSSSAALEVASAFSLMSVAGVRLPLAEIATLCRYAENNFVGARVGIMDPFVAARWSSSLFRCRRACASWSATQWSSTTLPLAPTTLAARSAKKA
jgi:galactokinase